MSRRGSERAELERADARARELVQRVFDRPLVLEAGAGTGKTTTLVARVLVWCLGPGWQRAEARESADALGGAVALRDGIAARVLRGVVAITFTEKAAAEMSTRIGAALEEVERDDAPDWLDCDALSGAANECAARARALRGALDHLTVQTIHGYCRRLLAEHALDAGLHPRLVVDADGRRRAEAVRAALEEWVRGAYTDPMDAAFVALVARGIGPRELEAELNALLEAGVTADALAADPLQPERVRAFAERLASALGEFERAEAGALQAAGGVAAFTAERVVETTASLAEARPGDGTALGAWLADLDTRWADNERARLADWGRDRFGQREAAALGDRRAAVARCAANLADLLAHAWSIDVALLEAARAVLRPPLEDVQARLRAGGVIGFSALLDETRALLHRRPDVVRRIRSGIDQLLVDEFQDTDSRQCEIIRALALCGAPDERPALFLVGDPKQSIYGWRSADLAAYDAFVADVLACGGARARLSRNFRSVPAILDEVERVIAPAMLPQAGLQPAFQPLFAARAEAGDATRVAGEVPPAVEHWIPASWDGQASAPAVSTAREVAELEARALACDLRALHDRHGVAWPNVGVLFRGRADWEVYLAALRDAGIPFAVEGDRSYYRRREIIDAASLVRCVLDPNDALALLTFLRSAAVGVPDAALVPLWSRQLPERFAALTGSHPKALERVADLVLDAVAALPDEAPGLDRARGWEDNLIAAAIDVAHLRDVWERAPVDCFVEELRTRTLFEASEAARHLGAWRCANLERFFRELLEALVEGESAPSILRRLRTAVVSEQEAEEGRPMQLAADAVQVMTIHGAKGLDFDHVYLMQLHMGSGRNLDPGRGVAEVAGAVEYGLFGAPTLAWDRVVARSEAVREAERVRLLYVAMTRARSRLVLSGARAEHQKRPGPGQPVALLQHRDASKDFARAMCSAAQAGRADAIDERGVRWFFPALAGLAAPAPPCPTELPPLLDAEAMTAMSDALVALGEGARARAARPVGEAATEVARLACADRPQLEAEPVAGARERERGGGLDPASARAVGTAIHRALETFDFDAQPELSLERQRRTVARSIECAGLERPDAAREAALALLDRIVAHACFARLRALSAHIVARELPVLLPPSDHSGPTGFVSGAIDLVYRDPETGELVVADFKTDRIADEAALEQQMGTYAAQGAIYQCAVREALQLPYTPRFELWFLEADRVVALAPAPPA